MSSRDPQRVFPGEIRTSAAIKQKLGDQDALLEVKERDLVYKPRTITLLKNTIKGLDEKIRDPKNLFGATHRLQRSEKMKVLRTEEAALKNLPMEIKALKRELKDLRARLAKARAEEQMAYAKRAGVKLNTHTQPAPRQETREKHPMLTLAKNAATLNKTNVRKETILVKVSSKRKAADTSRNERPNKRPKSMTMAPPCPGMVGDAAPANAASAAIPASKSKAEKIAGRSSSPDFPGISAVGDIPASPSADKAENNRKRAAPSDDGESDGPPVKRHAGENARHPIDDDIDEDEMWSDRSKRPGNLNGLINHCNSCFSAVIIQLLDAALRSLDLDALLGDLEEVEAFGTDDKTCRSFDKTAHLGEMDQKAVKYEKAVRAAIRAAAKAGESEKVSAVKHLRSLLADLHEDIAGAGNQYISPYLFQSVLAWGAPQDADRADGDLSDRQKMSGDSQECCFDYYQTVLNALLNDPHTKDSNAVRSLFEVETEVTEVCSRVECDYRSEAHKATNNYHDIPVPKTAKGKQCQLGSLFKASKKSKKQETCPQCLEGDLIAETSFTKVAENLVVKMSRTRYDEASGEPSKVDTLVDLKPHTLDIEGADYELSAVIRHSGYSASFGHYTIFRKQGEDWYLLSDKDRSKKMTSADVKDSVRSGQCAMLLLKKVEA